MPLVRLSADEPPEPSLAPMIDVVLVLTMFFMCATRFSSEERAFDVELPRASSAEPTATSRPEIIEVGADGTIRIKGEAVTVDELPALMDRIRGDGRTDVAVLVRGDRAASHGRMAEVYQACRTAGVRHVGISVQVTASKAAERVTR